MFQEAGKQTLIFCYYFVGMLSGAIALGDMNVICAKEATTVGATISGGGVASSVIDGGVATIG